MKKLALLVILGALYQHWPTVKFWLQPAAVRGTPQVVLYATQWCGYCAKARQQLSSDGVPYQEIDIERDAAGAAQYKALGGNGIPLLQINGKLIHGYNPTAMRAAY
ncbi:glutaredoxin family protein [Pseudomonas sp. 5P_3.1_Bac2]|uniref:glutaredoxin family protein n=1 Tax=Pseudomonas sp. 5P_3.1_Bac2 TaxID=2971617 RepID=UPI0021CADC9C|nr:glutaredoxin family protein [Pseudomonas sp. 5P_3.1_Bac2]MCU1719485.1 glutaredoxin family protein [Pseudomonas sp. 5P_3.1_Bac2]